jgi:hypothetical protein
MEPFVNFNKLDYEKKFGTKRGKIDFILGLKKFDDCKCLKDKLVKKSAQFLNWAEKKLNEHKSYCKRKPLPAQMYKPLYQKYFTAFEDYKNNEWWFSNNPVYLVYYQIECLKKHNLWLTNSADFTEAAKHIFEKAFPDMSQLDKQTEPVLFWLKLKKCNNYENETIVKYTTAIENAKKQNDKTVVTNSIEEEK